LRAAISAVLDGDLRLDALLASCQPRNVRARICPHWSPARLTPERRAKAKAAGAMQILPVPTMRLSFMER
jgi:hypothetical protein